ncbi:hypothetical protein TGGT1_297290 [Toxoplasma gondii GT1]|uniref:Uncharacterized protein n=4 Tax=Toxoplasma gondii TaxID=5811 RepID=S7UJZ2_TOXGG|nr:hypothetical protein TGGT1_297290 [Toxoplasma gondii GT1]KAF4645726.1 hypothetical protein TGRH88_002120 [Toxoplasma gondii]KFG39834.1 hypothetical protein TGFOU_297290 [Toxoplasma gondii FOU]RQX67429.1 hypothetical protein TGCAST_297290 [Toxoplasma gondii CAST]
MALHNLFCLAMLTVAAATADTYAEKFVSMNLLTAYGYPDLSQAMKGSGNAGYITIPKQHTLLHESRDLPSTEKGGAQASRLLEGSEYRYSEVLQVPIDAEHAVTMGPIMRRLAVGSSDLPTSSSLMSHFSPSPTTPSTHLSKIAERLPHHAVSTGGWHTLHLLRPQYIGDYRGPLAAAYSNMFRRKSPVERSRIWESQGENTVPLKNVLGRRSTVGAWRTAEGNSLRQPPVPFKRQDVWRSSLEHTPLKDVLKRWPN